MSALAPAKAWWEQASGRDQLFLVVGGLFVSIFLCYSILLKPVKNMAEVELTKVKAQKMQLERVRIMANQLIAKNVASGHAKKGTVEREVEDSLNANDLRVTGFDASSKAGIRVRFERANFDKLLSWIYDMEQTRGLRIKDISIVAGSEEGAVSANLLIQK